MVRDSLTPPVPVSEAGRFRAAYWGDRKAAALQARIDVSARRGVSAFEAEVAAGDVSFWDRLNPNGWFNWGGDLPEPEGNPLSKRPVDETDLPALAEPHNRRRQREKRAAVDTQATVPPQSKPVPMPTVQRPTGRVEA